MYLASVIDCATRTAHYRNPPVALLRRVGADLGMKRPRTSRRPELNALITDGHGLDLRGRSHYAADRRFFAPPASERKLLCRVQNLLICARPAPRQG